MVTPMPFVALLEDGARVLMGARSDDLKVVYPLIPERPERTARVAEPGSVQITARDRPTRPRSRPAPAAGAR